MLVKIFYQCLLGYGGIALALVIVIDSGPWTLGFTTYRFPSVFLRRSISDASNGYNKYTDLALGRTDMRFVLFFINEGFHFRYTEPILYLRKTTEPQGRITMLTIPFLRSFET